MKRKGYTLVEVMAAIVIFMLAVETITFSMAAASKISGRAQKIAEAGQRVRSGKDKIPAEFSLRLSDDAEPITGDGYMSMEEINEEFSVRSIWTTVSLAPLTEETEENSGGKE